MDSHTDNDSVLNSSPITKDIALRTEEWIQLLRNKLAVSDIKEFTEGANFSPVILDDVASKETWT